MSKKTQRDTARDTAHRLSGGPLELHWSENALATPGGSLDPAAQTLRDYLLKRSPDLAARGLIFGTTSASATTPSDPKHTTLISLRLKDGSWLNVTLARVQSTQITSPSFVISTLVGALGVLAVAVLLGRWLTHPLNKLADGARNLFAGDDKDQPLKEIGTREVRTVAAAINEMQRRIQRMVNNRTQMLAAISHDLRTPLTRLRLRENAVEDDELNASINRDIDEMEQMIDATLDFLRENVDKENIEPVDLSAILHTIGDDASDTGQKVTVEVPRSLVLRGRHLALKRAFTNLIHNAIKHGGSATVSARQKDTEYEIVISDQGPGIPPDKLEAVFAPFCRLDDARSRETGGYGLGLTVARSIARSHGGDVELSNHPTGGLQVRVLLPRQRT